MIIQLFTNSEKCFHIPKWTLSRQTRDLQASSLIVIQVPLSFVTLWMSSTNKPSWQCVTSSSDAKARKLHSNKHEMLRVFVR